MIRYLGQGRAYVNSARCGTPIHSSPLYEAWRPVWAVVPGAEYN